MNKSIILYTSLTGGVASKTQIKILETFHRFENPGRRFVKNARIKRNQKDTSRTAATLRKLSEKFYNSVDTHYNPYKL